MRIGEWVREVETDTRLLPMRILNPEEQPEQIPVVVEQEVEPAAFVPAAGSNRHRG